MQARRVALISCIALVALALLWVGAPWTQTAAEPGALAEGAPDAAAEAQAAADERAAEGDGALRLERDARQELATDGPRFFARLVDARGAPLPDMRVDVRHQPASLVLSALAYARHDAGWRDGVTRRGQVRTASDGSFSCALPTSGFLVLSLRAQRHSIAPDACYYCGGESDVRAGDIPCIANRTIRGRVVDAADDSPIAGARLRVFHERGSSDARSADDGSFALVDICGRARSAVVTAHDHESRRSSEFPESADEPWIVRLERARSVLVHVVDEAGQAIPTARVHASSRIEARAIRVDAGGRARVPIEEPRAASTLNISARGYASAFLRLAFSGAENRVVLPHRCALRGQLVDKRGRAMRHVELRFQRRDERQPAQKSGILSEVTNARTDGAGAFSVTLAPGSYVVWARGDRVLEKREETLVPLQLRDARDGVVLQSMRVLHALAFRVVDEAQRPVGRARAELREEGELRDFRCDADGRVTVELAERVAPRALDTDEDAPRLRFLAPGFGTVTVDLERLRAAAVDAATPTEVTLSAAARLQIVCLDRKGARIRNGTVFAWHGADASEGREADASWSSDSRGVIDAPGLRAGDWRLRLAEQGAGFQLQAFSSASVRASPRSELRLSLAAGERRRFTLRDRTPPTLHIQASWLGAALAEGDVRLREVATGRSRSARLREGRAEFAATEAGQYLLSISPPPSGFAFDSRLQVSASPAEQTRHVALTGASLLLRFERPAPAESHLTVHRKGRAQIRFAIAGKRELNIEPLPPGDYEIRQGKRSLSTVRIRGLERVTRDVTLRE